MRVARAAVVLVALLFALSYSAVAQTLEERVATLEDRLKKVDEDQESRRNDLRVFFKRGLRLETADGVFKLKIGMRVHNDYVAPIRDDDDRGNLSIDERLRALFRRARIYLSGTIYENVGFKLQVDFARGDADFKDAFVELRKVLGAFAIRVGQFKEPFSFGQLTSSNYITFMERATLDSLSPSRSTGLMVHGRCLDDFLAWAAGVFFDSDDYGDRDRPPSIGSEFNFTGRLAATPVFADDGQTVIHIGVSASHRNPNDDDVRFRARPEMRTRNRFVDTGTMLNAETVSLYNGAVAVVLGPLHASAEYTHVGVNLKRMDDPAFRAYYAQVGFFLTGESRTYDNKKKVFGRIVPNSNLGDDGGIGAVEVAARLSNIDLNEGATIQTPNGGALNAVTVGLNWYLNPNARVMLNFVHANRDRAEAYQFAGLRVQVDF